MDFLSRHECIDVAAILRTAYLTQTAESRSDADSSNLVMCCVKKTGQVRSKSNPATTLTMVALNTSARSVGRVLDRHRDTSHQSEEELAVCPRGIA